MQFRINIILIDLSFHYSYAEKMFKLSIGTPCFSWILAFHWDFCWMIHQIVVVINYSLTCNFYIRSSVIGLSGQHTFFFKKLWLVRSWPWYIYIIQMSRKHTDKMIILVICFSHLINILLIGSSFIFDIGCLVIVECGVH